MIIEVGAKIRVKDPSPDLLKWARVELTLENPAFYKLEKLGKWTGNTPREIALYEIVGNELWLPFGCLSELWSKIGSRATWEPLFFDLRRVNYQSNIKVYPYQEKAVRAAIKAKNGILVMPTGSGKTQTALELISRIGGRCLWLTHTQDLLRQSKSRSESVLSIDGNYGTITAGKVKIGSHITFATVQTMAKLDLSEYKDYWDMIVVDECAHCAGSPTKVTQFYKVLSNLSARYKIGLTATPKRADGLEKAMFALLGNVICEISRDEVAHTTCPVKVSIIPTGWTPDYEAVLMGDGTINYAALVDNLTHSKSRFKTVLETIEKLPAHAPVLVLANRVEYLKSLNKEYCGSSQCLSGMGTSKTAKAERARALKALNDGDIDCLFASYQLAAEGLDCPNLRYVVFATPEKDSTRIIQSVGRVCRKAEGKEYGTVIDFVDDFGLFQGWLKKRKGFYKKIGAEVMDVQ